MYNLKIRKKNWTGIFCIHSLKIEIVMTDISTLQDLLNYLLCEDFVLIKRYSYLHCCFNKEESNHENGLSTHLYQGTFCSDICFLIILACLKIDILSHENDVSQ